MLIRIVRMTFRPDALETFLERFDATAPQIRAVEGCLHLELWQSVRFPNICTTCSHWQSEADLERYRRSELFRRTWREVRPLFAAPPQAHSYAVLRSASDPEPR